MSTYHQVVESVISGLTRFFNSAFSSVNIDGPVLDPKQLQRNPIMMVCTHRSHVDYFLLGWIYFKKGFKNLRFAAGDNLTRMPYLGKRLTAFGAFTVARDTGFERHYVRNLCEQVVKMLADHEPVIVFPEGGRSYSGAELDIKSGVIGAAVLLQARMPERDVLILPASISYECPPDAPFFKMLLTGKRLRKRTNTFFQRRMGDLLYFGADLLAFVPFVLSRRIPRNYGAVYVDYREPVSVRQLVNLQQTAIAGARDEFSAHRDSMSIVGEEIARQFRSLFRILPMHLLASVLIRNKPLTIEAAVRLVEPLLEKTLGEPRNTASIRQLDSAGIVEQGIRQFLKLKAIKVCQGQIEIQKGSIIDYFAAALT